MKTKVLTQAEKRHNPNTLHDAFIEAQIVPIRVESTETESRFMFQDSVTDQAIQNVITTHEFSLPAGPADLKTAWLAYKNAVNNASTVAQIKSALTTELGVLLKELLQSRTGPLNG